MLKYLSLPILMVMFYPFFCFSIINESDLRDTIYSISQESENIEGTSISEESDLGIGSNTVFISHESKSNNNPAINPFWTQKIDFKAEYTIKGERHKLETIQNKPDTLSTQNSIFNGIILKVKRIIYTLIKILIVFLLVITLYTVYNFIRNKNLKIKRIEKEISELNNQLIQKESQINYLKSFLKSSQKNTDQVEVYKTEEEIKNIKSKVIDDIIFDNKLSNEELSFLKKESENRWVVLGHSAPGSIHIKSSPPIPCQDSHYFEIMENGWVLSIVCDGAGSAIHSNLGSKYLAKTALPLNFKLLLSKSSWYKSGILPNEEEWRQSIMHLFEKSLDDLKDWVLKSNYHKENQKEFATTVILSLHNNKGILIANIGDGRGGYLNNQGELMSLFVPFRGDESNSTIFITSDIWGKSNDFINTKVINDIPLSVFILSDGLEKISFNCSLMVDGVWVDPNIPFRNFFYPIFKNIKEIPKEFEFRLINDWENLLENGNERIKNENDDKTMVLSFLK